MLLANQTNNNRTISTNLDYNYNNTNKTRIGNENILFKNKITLENKTVTKSTKLNQLLREFDSRKGYILFGKVKTSSLLSNCSSSSLTEAIT